MHDIISKLKGEKSKKAKLFWKPWEAKSSLALQGFPKVNPRLCVSQQVEASALQP
jgi:hypothetical protein